MKLYFVSIIIVLTACSNNTAERTFVFDMGSIDRAGSPVYLVLDNESLDENDSVCLHTDDEVLPAQIETVSESVQWLWLIPGNQSAASTEYTLRTGEECYDRVYTWESINNESKLLTYGDQPVLQYEHPMYNSEDIEGTKKPFHHLFDPAGGQVITKGPGGLYTHHRGIFFGYNHVYLDDSRVDIWHSRDGERSEHAEVLKEFTGPVMGGHIVRIQWKDFDGEPFLEEMREIRVFKQSDDETLVDFRSVLEAVDGPVMLDGDRQHAGVQFRAAQYVADNDEYTRFIRPGNLAHVAADEEIEGGDMMDLPWNAMHFRVNDKAYTVAYLSHPLNPGDAEMSERLYGRFGEFFRYEVTPDNPLRVHYRFVVRSGEMTPQEIERHYANFADSPEVRTD
jgi:hypothetical protein